MHRHAHRRGARLGEGGRPPQHQHRGKALITDIGHDQRPPPRIRHTTERQGLGIRLIVGVVPLARHAAAGTSEARHRSTRRACRIPAAPRSPCRHRDHTRTSASRSLAADQPGLAAPDI